MNKNKKIIMFKKGNNNSIIARIDGKISFINRYSKIKDVELNTPYIIKISGENPKKTVFFLDVIKKVIDAEREEIEDLIYDIEINENGVTALTESIPYRVKVKPTKEEAEKIKKIKDEKEEEERKRIEEMNKQIEREEKFKKNLSKIRKIVEEWYLNAVNYTEKVKEKTKVEMPKNEDIPYPQSSYLLEEKEINNSFLRIKKVRYHVKLNVYEIQKEVLGEYVKASYSPESPDGYRSAITTFDTVFGWHLDKITEEEKKMIEEKYADEIKKYKEKWNKEIKEYEEKTNELQRKWNEYDKKIEEAENKRKKLLNLWNKYRGKKFLEEMSKIDVEIDYNNDPRKWLCIKGANILW